MFIDDVLIYSNNIEQHRDHLHTVLQTLRSHKLYAKFSKCDFWINEVMFLGHVVFGGQISVDLVKIQVVTQWKPSKNASEIRSFLGMAGYYKRFIQNFSSIALPMTKLTQKNVKFIWSPEC